jgi:hypothetical protein
MKNEIILQNIQNYNFRDCSRLLTTEFIKSLQNNDIFSCHCRDFISFLRFKRCDKYFREKFYDFCKINNLHYIISNKPLTKNVIHNFLNAEEIVQSRLNEKINPANPNSLTQKQFYKWVAKESGQTYQQVLDDQIKNLRNIFGTLEIKLDKQKLEGSFNGGCWLVVLKIK